MKLTCPAQICDAATMQNSMGIDAMVLKDGSQNAALFQAGSVHPNSAGYEVMASVHVATGG